MVWWTEAREQGGGSGASNGFVGYERKLSSPGGLTTFSDLSRILSHGLEAGDPGHFLIF